MVSIAKSLCSGSERRSRGRPPSENSKEASLHSILHFDNEMHLLHLQISILCNR